MYVPGLMYKVSGQWTLWLKLKTKFDVTLNGTG
jgi:hypothetical protein